MEEGGRRRAEATERFSSGRGGSVQEESSWSSTEILYQRHYNNNLHQRSYVSTSGTCTDLGGRCQAASPSPGRERQSQGPDSMLVYDDVLKQHRRLLSKLDLEEKRRTEAREGGEQRGVKEE